MKALSIAFNDKFLFPAVGLVDVHFACFLFVMHLRPVLVFTYTNLIDVSIDSCTLLMLSYKLHFPSCETIAAEIVVFSETPTDV